MENDTTPDEAAPITQEMWDRLSTDPGFRDDKLVMMTFKPERTPLRILSDSTDGLHPFFGRHSLRDAMSTKPIRYEVGDKVCVTERNFRTIVNGNRSIKVYPSDSYLAQVAPLIGVQGVITRVFPPGYELTVKFGDVYLHMKDNWVEKA